ncbi:MAG: cobalamin-binding protein [Pseudomonadota bacterium]|nr:cobalamin-binding protein [Pseudomonadota bacterium]
MASAQITVRDDLGFAVELDRPAQRIVSLAPHVTELLFAAGAGERIVGTVDYSDFPPEAQRVPSVGSYTGVDMEALLGLRPDLVIAWQSGNIPRQLEQIVALGVPVYRSEPRHLADVAAALRHFGLLAGTETVANQAAASFEFRWRALQSRYATRPSVRVFYQIWHRPLMTINGEHLISEVMSLCGGQNVFVDVSGLAPAVSLEAVVLADPEVIVASGMGESRPQWLDQWARWPDLTAVARGNLFFIPPALLQRHTPRILDGAERLCEALEKARSRRIVL